MKFEKLVAGCLAVGLMGSAVPFVDVNDVPAITVKAEEVIDSGKINKTFSYVLTDDGVLTISGEGEMPDFTSNSGDWTKNYSKVKTLVVEEGITSLGESFMYNMMYLESVSLPSTLEVIGNSAFNQCSRLTEINIPDGVTTIGEKAFRNCKNLKTISIPDSVTSLGNGAFNCCVDLEEVRLSSNLTEIPDYCFNWCYPLAEITIPDGVTSIGSSAFCETALQTITIPDSVKTIGSVAFRSCSKLEEVFMGNGVETIESSAFKECKKLFDVHFSENLKSIDSQAFWNCTMLEDVTLPVSVETLNTEIFSGCKNLTDAIVLNSECTFSMGSSRTFPLETIVHGYADSTAQAYAEKFGNEFVSIGENPIKNDILGDINKDGVLTVADIVEMNQKLHSLSGVPQIGDMNQDGIVNVIDLALLKRALLNQ